MSVGGRYKDKFSEATHCLFNGHLDDPFFQGVAIQKILEIGDDSLTSSPPSAFRLPADAGKDGDSYS